MNCRFTPAVRVSGVRFQVPGFRAVDLCLTLVAFACRRKTYTANPVGGHKACSNHLPPIPPGKTHGTKIVPWSRAFCLLEVSPRREKSLAVVTTAFCLLIPAYCLMFARPARDVF